MKANSIKLSEMHMLYRQTIVKRGPLGSSYLLYNLNRTKQPMIAKRSPSKRCHPWLLKYDKVVCYVTGRNKESHNIIMIPIVTSRLPPIYPSWHCSFLYNLTRERTKNFNLKKQNEWEPAVSLVAITPNKTQTQWLNEHKYILLKLLNFKRYFSFYYSEYTHLCSLITKGIIRTDIVKNLQPFLVIPSHSMSTVIQQGTIPFRITDIMSRNHLWNCEN